MRESLLRMEFYETYSYANVIQNVLSAPFEFIRSIHSWHEDQEASLFLQSFPKWSVLHSFSEYVIGELIYETLDDVAIGNMSNNSRDELWIDRALRHHGIETEGFRRWLKQQNISLQDVSGDHAHDYHNELRLTGELDTLINQLTNEVFHVLFSNRLLLARLNDYIAGVVSRIKIDDLYGEDTPLLQKDGTPARTYIPEWARRAVYFRDRGMCASCNTDLTGLISISSAEHYDHIIPLAEGGINDVTNLQLLCQTCNLKKGKRNLSTSNRYQAWYTH